jgi:hypothetical protein
MFLLFLTANVRTQFASDNFLAEGDDGWAQPGAARDGCGGCGGGDGCCKNKGDAPAAAAAGAAEGTEGILSCVLLVLLLLASTCGLAVVTSTRSS